MTIVTFLQDAVSGVPQNTGQSVRQALASAAGYAPDGRPLGAASGVRAGTPATTVTATSTTWTVGPHGGVLDLETPAASGPLWYAVSVAETGAMSAASSSNPRIDLITLRSNEPDQGDGSSVPGVTVQYYAGTPASSPTAPATPSGEFALANINVPVLGGGSPSVTWVAPSMSPDVIAYANGVGSGQSIPNATTTTLAGWTGGVLKNLTYSAGVWTVIFPGWYDIDAKVAYPNVSPANGQRVGNLLVNGALVCENVTRPDVTFHTHLPLAYGGLLNAGDTISVQTYQSQTTSQSLLGGPGLTLVSIRRRCGA